MYYYIPQPPFFIPIVGLFVALIFGITFQSQMQQRIQSWLKDPKTKGAYKLEGTDLTLSYQGICLGIWVFLGGGLQIFGFGVISSFGVALLLTIGSGAFLWQQFGEMLVEVQKNGAKALDLDN
ncbi:MAG: hypothetical protein QNJ70_11865 [Xenococcaceae cyanobacterium MO_207.B15]|nr:hypothetical protein [Xenococcaceae cyanobacterium MO_207.B15]